jgi:hypothetical protein
MPWPLRQAANAISCMLRPGREASPTAAAFDSQGVKSPESDGPRGYDAGKRIKGRTACRDPAATQAMSARQGSALARFASRPCAFLAYA